MRIVYCAQFRDFSGYGIAARGYLKALDSFLKKNPNSLNLKVYSAVVGGGNLSEEEDALIGKYEFKNDEEISQWLKEDYTFVWHMPPAMVFFSDEKFNPSPNCSPSIKKLLKQSRSNINLTVWETTKIPREYVRTHEYHNPDAIITSSKWNQEAFNEYIECHVVPHLIEEPKKEFDPIKLPYDLNKTFTIFSSSQWSRRKGFDVLLQAFVAEFGDQNDVRLLLKTYPSVEAKNDEVIQSEVRFYRNIIRTSEKVNNIILMSGFMSKEKINWLYDKCDVFALLTRGEGFSLPIAESLMRSKPVIVPKEGGHIDYIHPDSAFFVDGSWDTCISVVPPYDIDGEWFECSIKDARKRLREAYDCWKMGNLHKKGKAGRDHILKSGYDLESVGNKLVKTIKEVAAKSQEETKLSKLKRAVASKKSLEEKLEVLRNSYEGETCYILNCGPSLNEMAPNVIREHLKDKLVFAVKQAYNKFADISDFHFFNCANLPSLKKNGYFQEHYKYDDKTIAIASSNYNMGTRWSAFQKQDLFFKVPIRTEINNEFVVKTKDFDKYLMSDHAERPCGPGIMYETVIYMALHLGVKKIVALGWDLSYNDPKSYKEYKHFYGGTDKLVNRGDILPWEITATREASEELFKWLKNKGVELELVSNQSTLYEEIPRVKL